MINNNYIDYPVPNPFLAYIGAKLIYANNKGCCFELAIDENLTNSWGNFHGGVMMTLMDVAMSWSARFYNKLEVRGAMTINFNSQFIKSANKYLIVTAKVLKTTQTLAFCEANIIEDDELIATASATFKYAKKLL